MPAILSDVSNIIILFSIYLHLRQNINSIAIGFRLEQHVVANDNITEILVLNFFNELGVIMEIMLVPVY